MSFDGIYEKLKRADENILNLKAEIDGFIQSGQYPTIPHPNDKTWKEAVDYHKGKPIPLRFSVLAGERLWKVQVKSTYCPCRRGYRTVGYRGDKKPYTNKEIDFLVAYIAPKDVWYVIPVRFLAKALPLNFYPSDCKRGSGYFEFCREAWHFMAPGPDATPRPQTHHS